jgi:hypothetical protein
MIESMIWFVREYSTHAWLDPMKTPSTPAQRNIVRTGREEETREETRGEERGARMYVTQSHRSREYEQALEAVKQP